MRPMNVDVSNANFVDIPGFRGLRVARIGTKLGQSLELIDAASGVIIPALKHPSAESGRVLSGSLRFMQDGVVKTLRAGDTWTVAADQTQGPHVILEDGTRVAILRSGRSALDIV